MWACERESVCMGMYVCVCVFVCRRFVGVVLGRLPRYSWHPPRRTGHDEDNDTYVHDAEGREEHLRVPGIGLDPLFLCGVGLWDAHA